MVIYSTSVRLADTVVASFLSGLSAETAGGRAKGRGDPGRSGEALGGSEPRRASSSRRWNATKLGARSQKRTSPRSGRCRVISDISFSHRPRLDLG